MPLATVEDGSQGRSRGLVAASRGSYDPTMPTVYQRAAAFMHERTVAFWGHHNEYTDGGDAPPPVEIVK